MDSHQSFYKAFWTEMRDVLEVFTESFNDSSLPPSCRRAVLILLPKRGDLQDRKNWRPVSLICTDYKLLSKVLANRLNGDGSGHPLNSNILCARQVHC